MKRLKIKTKLMLGFLLVAVLTVAIGLTGIFVLTSSGDGYMEIVSQNLGAVRSLADMRESYQLQRLMLRAMMVDINSAEKVQSDIDSLRIYEADMLKAMGEFESVISDPEAKKDYLTFKESYSGTYTSVKEDYLIAVLSADFAAAEAVLAEGMQAAQIITSGLEGAVEFVSASAESDSSGISQNISRMTVLLICIMALSTLLALGIGIYISNDISKPMIHIAKSFEQFGRSGNFEIDEQSAKQAAKNAERGDEIGDCAKSALELVAHLVNIQNVLGSIAGCDLTVSVKTLSERDSVGLSVTKVLETLNNMFGEINSAANQVSSGTRQVSDGAQALAQGSTEQAAAVEQLSSSISGIAKKTKENAEMANYASELAGKIKHSAEKGSRQMDQMLAAVKDIEAAGVDIGRVIKVIDDIAFQTNILALNAAVEAARAGQHGKGFAVVAEEVRNLAAKSAEAAKDTGSLIANSIGKAELGASIAAETAVSLSEIVTGINESGKIALDIAQSSEQQAVAIAQINGGIEQVAQVVQQNSATAQESAAAAQEMSDQADTLEELVDRFKIVAVNTAQAKASAPRSKIVMAEKPDYRIEDEVGMGKY